MPRLFLASLAAFPALLAQAPPGPPPFRAAVDNQPIELHEFERGAFGQIELTKPAEVEIRPGFYVRWVDIRPKSAGMLPVIASDHLSVRFQVKRPTFMTVEFNGDVRRVLHLFAVPPEKDVPKPDTANVRYFGPGVHEPGLIDLKDGETLYLAKGAWVKGLVQSTGTKGVTIRGRGVLDASHLAQPAPGSRGRRNMIYFEKTQGARIEGITLFNSQTWTLYLRNSDDARIEGVKILNYGPCGTDGIDIVASRNVLVEDVFVRANDDCVVVKNMDSLPVHDITVRRAVFWNMPCGNAIEIGFEMRAAKTERIRFEDIDIIRVERGSAISIHNGDSALIEDVLFENIRVEDARHKLIDFAVVYGRYGATDRPDRSRPSDAGGAWDGVMHVTPQERAERGKDRGYVRNIRVRNLHVLDGPLPFSLISGFDKDHTVENVKIEGLKYLGRPVKTAAEGKFSIDHAPGFEIR